MRMLSERILGILPPDTAFGYFDDVDPDETLPAPRQQVVDYWTRRQREIIAARSR